MSSGENKVLMLWDGEHFMTPGPELSGALQS